MNGAQSLARSLPASGIDTRFATPGTGEMRFVAALDEPPQMRTAPCVDEGAAHRAEGGAIAQPASPLRAEGDKVLTVGGPLLRRSPLAMGGADAPGPHLKARRVTHLQADRGAGPCATMT